MAEEKSPIKIKKIGHVVLNVSDIRARKQQSSGRKLRALNSPTETKSAWYFSAMRRITTTVALLSKPKRK